MAVLVLASGCGKFVLEEFNVAYACDHEGGDGGVQCAPGWSCGFDDRCFDRAPKADAGTTAQTWRCETDQQCPDHWRCGVALEGLSFCQQLDVGAPSQCRVQGDCEGGWRCGVELRCFDPVQPDVDAGVSRECTVSDAGEQCPMGYRCGERVAGQQRCVQLGVAADSACVSDRGCEGGRRCDTEASRCVSVTDVLSGSTTAVVTSAVRNPLLSLPVPLLFASSRVQQLRPLGMPGMPFRGVMSAALFDAGVLVSVQPSDSELPVDGGSTMISRVFVPLPPTRAASDVTTLALTLDGPALQYADGRAEVLRFDRSPEQLPRTGGQVRFIRQVDGFDPQVPSLDVVVGVAQQLFFRADGGRFTTQGDVYEAVVYDNPAAGAAQGIYAFTADGLLQYDMGGARANPTTLPGPALTQTPLQTVAGALPGDERLQFMMLLPLDGGLGIRPWLTNGPAPELTSSLLPLPACVVGQPVDLSIASGGNQGRAQALVECRADGGSVYGLALRFDPRNNDYTVRPTSVAQDSVPFARPFVTQKSSPFVRALGGADGRLWHAVDVGPGDRMSGASLLAALPLSAQTLDRQPETIASFTQPNAVTQQPESRSVGAVGSAGYFYDALNGFISRVDNSGDAVLAVFSNQPRWIATSSGVADLSAVALIGQPAFIASMPSPAVLSPPLAAATRKVRLNGSLRDVMLISSGDTVWAADVTANVANVFATPATLRAVLVPTPGIKLGSLTVDDASESSLSGFLTTTSRTLRFSTTDLTRWDVTEVATPPNVTLPLEVWTERQPGFDGGTRLAGRAGHADGRVWSLPIMVALTDSLGDAGTATDFGRLCGQLYATTSNGVYRAVPSTDGGLPWWSPVPAANVGLDDLTNLRLYETRRATDLLYVGTSTGKLLEIAPTTTCPDAG